MSKLLRAYRPKSMAGYWRLQEFLAEIKPTAESGILLRGL